MKAGPHDSITQTYIYARIIKPLIDMKTIIYTVLIISRFPFLNVYHQKYQIKFPYTFIVFIPFFQARRASYPFFLTGVPKKKSPDNVLYLTLL